MTPLTSYNKLPDNRSYVDYLASLPTPTYKSNVNGASVENKAELCPRKLSVEASPEPSPRISNRTFNVAGLNVPQIIVSNELDVIEEEGEKNTTRKANPLSRSRRDINMIATPLRKYSESMRDLNISRVSF